MTMRSLKYRLTLGILAIAACGSPQIEAQAQRRPDDVTLVGNLRSNEWPKRRKALDAVVALSPSQRTSYVVEAVAQELKRVQDVFDHGGRLAPVEAGDETDWDYYSDLVDIACASSDPVVIPPLVEAIGMGHPAIDAVARFGGAALPALLAAHARRKEPEFASMTLYALTLMVQRHRELTSVERNSIGTVALQHLKGRQYSVVVRRAIELSGNLRDPSHVPILQTIQRSHSAVEAGLQLVDPQGFNQLPAQAAAALARIH